MGPERPGPVVRRREQRALPGHHAYPPTHPAAPLPPPTGQSQALPACRLKPADLGGERSRPVDGGNNRQRRKRAESSTKQRFAFDGRETPAPRPVPAGYSELLKWLRSHGRIDWVGVEGTAPIGRPWPGTFRQGVSVIEVPRPDRRLRRQRGSLTPSTLRPQLERRSPARPPASSSWPTAASRRSAPSASLPTNHQGQDGCRQRSPGLVHHCAGAAACATEVSVHDQAGADLCRDRPDKARLHDPTQALGLALRSLAQRADALAIKARQLNRRLEALTHRCARDLDCLPRPRHDQLPAGQHRRQPGPASLRELLRLSLRRGAYPGFRQDAALLSEKGR